MEHDHDVPGAGPTRILSLEDGDAPEVPHEVEAELRRPSRRSRDQVLADFEADFVGSSYDRVGCLRDWRRLHPALTPDLDLIADSIDPMVRVSMGQPGHAPDASPLSPPPPRPTVAALGVCYVPLVLVTCLLAALRTGGAIGWDWGWVLAPVWLPMVLGTIALILASIVLAFLDERDAARRGVVKASALLLAVVAWAGIADVRGGPCDRLGVRQGSPVEVTCLALRAARIRGPHA